MRNTSYFPAHLKDESKVVGYFSYTNAGGVCCDGDACIIAGTEERMKYYINKMGKSCQKDIIKKTRFGEIISGIKQGWAYAFDEGAYSRFYDLATINGITDLPKKEEFLGRPDAKMHFIRIQFTGA
jgi:hypothetical protein